MTSSYNASQTSSSRSHQFMVPESKNEDPIDSDDVLPENKSWFSKLCCFCCSSSPFSIYYSSSHLSASNLSNTSSSSIASSLENFNKLLTLIPIIFFVCRFWGSLRSVLLIANEDSVSSEDFLTYMQVLFNWI